MGFLIDRLRIVATFLMEWISYGMPKEVGPFDREAVFILDGVGNFQLVPLLTRRVWRGDSSKPGTIFFRWQCRIPGLVLVDLIRHRRNRVMAARFAREILRFRREHPATRIHIVAFSGGTAIAVWACELLRGRAGLETLVLACSALSPTYDFSAAMHSVRGCYALVSHKDRFILGWGTRTFGTMNRKFSPSGGLIGFRSPVAPASGEIGTFQQIRWTPELKTLGHRGGHTGWASPEFLRTHLYSLLQGRPTLPIDESALTST